MKVPSKVTKGNGEMKMNEEKQCQIGLKRLKDIFIMATVGASMAKKTSSEQSIVGNPCKLLLVLSLATYLIFNSVPNQYLNCSASQFFSPFTRTPPSSSDSSPTNLSHIVFGILGFEKAWHLRKAYVESWWRPNATRGILYLDTAPTGDLLPWSPASPPYRVSDDLTKLIQEINPLSQTTIRLAHGISEVLRDVDDHENLRWLVMGDDDSLFFVDNIVDLLAQYDHTKYYYIGAQSDFFWANYWFSFDLGFGGAGYVLSYPLAKALANDMENCLRRYSRLGTADMIAMACIADLGVNLSPHKGFHQIDLRGDISGLLSSHPNLPLMSLHHFDIVKPIFPNMGRFGSTRHLMKAAALDQSRMLQQTICHQRKSNWTFSVSWGYSAHIYEQIMPRSNMQNPIQTSTKWTKSTALYMFNTRPLSNDSCEAPHVFFFKNVSKASTGILTTYTREAPRGLPPCSSSGNHTADFISEIRVFSPATKREQMGRCECCDVVSVKGAKAELKFRKCKINEIIA